MKLYSESTPLVVTHFSTEQFNDYYSSSSVISEEALSDYFYKIKDSFNTISNKLLSSNNDKIVTDVLSTRFETQHVAKRLKFSNIVYNTVQKPENFKGKYIDYSNVLISISSEAISSVKETLDTLKLAIASFMNEYTEDKVITIYGMFYFKELSSKIKAQNKQIANFFPVPNSSVKAIIKDVLKTLSDIDGIYKNIQVLDKVINHKTLEEINKISKECSDLVDLVIEQNTKSSILLKNDSAKKDLISAIHTSAEQVEQISYLYSNIIFFYSGVKSLSDELIILGDTK